VAGGIAFGRWVESLLFETNSSDPSAMVAPLTVMAIAAFLAVVPPAIRAVRTNPARLIGTEQ